MSISIINGVIQKETPQGYKQTKKAIVEKLHMLLSECKASTHQESKLDDKTISSVYLSIKQSDKRINYLYKKCTNFDEVVIEDTHYYLTQINIAKEVERLIFHLDEMTSFNTNLAQNLNGNRIEKINHNLGIKAMKNIYWNNWKEKDIFANITYTNLYPFFVEYVKFFFSNENNINILELCGGDGSLAKEILKAIPEVKNYTLIDLNKASLVKAKKNLSSFNQVDIIQDDIVTSSKFPNKTNLIIGSGALTYEVLPSKAAATVALYNATQCLEIGGYLLLSGYAPSFIDSNDLQHLGYKVINTFNPIMGQYFYVAQKK